MQVDSTRGAKAIKKRKEGFTPTEVHWFVRFSEGVSSTRVAEADMFHGLCFIFDAPAFSFFANQSLVSL